LGGFPGALADGVGMGFSGASADNAPSAMSDVVSAGQADHPGMGDAFYAKGGKVDAVAGPDPSGPDDGFIGADKGEYVVKKAAAKKERPARASQRSRAVEEVPEGAEAVPVEEKPKAARNNSGSAGSDKIAAMRKQLADRTGAATA